MRLVIPALVLLLTGAAARADALTIRDVIELTKAGISEEVLLALIDVDGGVYANDTDTLKALKEAGVSERVMVALVRSGRERRVPEPPPAVVEDAPPPQPQVVVIEHHEPRVEQVVVPVPVYVPVYTSRQPPQRVHRRDTDVQVGSSYDAFVPFHSAPPLARPERTEPVYWGFGGKLRPDAWGQPAPDRDRPADKGDKPGSDKPGSEKSRPK
jgi:hypothetical protein